MGKLNWSEAEFEPKPSHVEPSEPKPSHVEPSREKSSAMKCSKHRGFARGHPCPPDCELRQLFNDDMESRDYRDLLEVFTEQFVDGVARRVNNLPAYCSDHARQDLWTTYLRLKSCGSGDYFRDIENAPPPVIIGEEDFPQLLSVFNQGFLDRVELNVDGLEPMYADYAYGDLWRTYIRLSSCGSADYFSLVFPNLFPRRPNNFRMGLVFSAVLALGALLVFALNPRPFHN